MTRITVDSELRTKLHNCEDLLEMCDESGRTLGYFHPVQGPSAASGRQVSSPISDEEINRCRQQRTGKPLSDILADLERGS